MKCFTLICISAAMALARSSCPHLALQKVKSCTSDLGIDMITGSSQIGADGHDNTERLAWACGNGTFLIAIRCVENIVEECRGSHSEQAVLLRKMIDSQTVRRSLNFLCANIQAYTVNRECIASYHDNQVACAREAMTNFQSGASGTTSVEALVRAQCTLYKTMEECAQSVLQKMCSRDAADIVTVVLEGFRPPSCPATVSGRITGDGSRTINEGRDVPTRGGKTTYEEKSVLTGNRRTLDEGDSESTDERQAIHETRGVTAVIRQTVCPRDGSKAGLSSGGHLTVHWIVLVAVRSVVIVVRHLRVL